MEHPTYEELLTLIEKTGSASSVKALKRHVDQCPQCRAELGAWQTTIRRLEGYGWPTLHEVRPALTRTLLRWSAAAAIILAIGFGLGRLSRPSSDQLKQMIAQQVEQQVDSRSSRLVQDTLQAVQWKQTENQRMVFAMLNQLREKHEADFFSLRHDLETAASVADGDLQRSQQQLNQLAAAVLVKDQ
jgi:hypothetical protein